MIKKYNIKSILIFFQKHFLFLCALLLCIQFVFNRSFYLDEASLALNIVEKNWADLLTPLAHFQVAPILFLWLSKFAWWLGASDLWLRFPVFLAGLGSLFFVNKLYHISSKYHGWKEAQIFIAFLVFLSTPFYRYATEFKQYGVELFICLGFYYFLVAEKHRWLLFWVLVGSFLSSSLSILLPLILLKSYWDYRDQKLNWSFLFPFFIGMLIYAFQYLYFFRDHPTKAYMQDFWSYAFMSHHVFSLEFYTWFLQRFSVVCYEIFYPNIFDASHLKYVFMFLPFIGLFLMSFGIFSLAKHHHIKALQYILLPVFIHLLLSSFQVYPFAARTLHYLLFHFLILAGFGLFYASKFKVGRLIVGIFLSAYFVNFLINFPIETEEVKSNLTLVAQEIKDDESLYVFYDIQNVVKYYLKDKALQNTGLTNKIVFGEYYIKKEMKVLDIDYQLLCGKNGYLIFGNTNELSSRKSSFDFSKEIFFGKNAQQTDENTIVNKIGNTRILNSERRSNLHTFDLTSCQQ